MKSRWTKYALVGFLLTGTLYIGSYLVLSRRGMALANSHGSTLGFYYIEPPAEHSRVWTATTIWLCVFYSPLNKLDCALGTGMPAINNALYVS